MSDLKSFKQRLHLVNNKSFNSFALELFIFQFENNNIYNLYCRNLGIDASQIKKVEQIPFLPISFFKSGIVKTGYWEEELVFTSSGTTGENTSLHYLESVDFYFKNTEKIFANFYDNPEEFVFLALLPSYLERTGSSLVAMIEYFIKRSKYEESGFYLHNINDLINALKYARESSKKVILWGVTFALIDLAEKYKMDLSNITIIETGGMKGRRDELTRNEVHTLLKSKFNVSAVHSEYGMTELLSQAYSIGGGKFFPPSWMKIFLREINDPLTIDNSQKQGAINIIDLANIHSCSFIATDDLGAVHRTGSFEILGRLDNSDIRGCNLLLK